MCLHSYWKQDKYFHQTETRMKAELEALEMEKTY